MDNWTAYLKGQEDYRRGYREGLAGGLRATAGLSMSEAEAMWDAIASTNPHSGLADMYLAGKHNGLRESILSSLKEILF